VTPAYYVDEDDLKFNNLSLDEAIDMAQNRPLWRLMSAFGATNPIFIVKTQLTERSRITDKHRENHIKKHHEH